MLLWVVVHAGCGKAMPAWQKWYQMQDSFDLTAAKALPTVKGAVKPQPRLQSITSAVFPPVCLTETAQGRSGCVGRHSQLPKLPAHVTSKLAKRTSTATRLVLNDRSISLKALAPQGHAFVDLQQRRAKRS